MKIQIIAKVKINFDDPRKTDVVVRKVVTNDNDELIGIFGLSSNGDWLPKEEGKPYPPECHLPIVVYDNFSLMGIVDEG